MDDANDKLKYNNKNTFLFKKKYILRKVKTNNRNHSSFKSRIIAMDMIINQFKLSKIADVTGLKKQSISRLKILKKIQPETFSLLINK